MGAVCSSEKPNANAADENPATKEAETANFGESSQEAASAAAEKKKVAESVRNMRKNREHRNVVVGENCDDLEDVDIPNTPKSEASTAAITKALQSHFLFGSLRPKEMLRVAGAMEGMSVAKGTTVITQGDVGEKADKFFVIQSGSFDIFVDGKKVLTESAGSSFGELALMYNAPRAATVTANSDSEVFTLTRTLFKVLLIEVTKKQAQNRMRFLKEVPLLKRLQNGELDYLSQCLSVIQYETGTTIIKQGEEGNTFYIVEEGCVTVHKNNNPEPVSTLSVGGYFGEQALMKNEVRTATVRAKGLVRCLVISQEDFEKIFGKMEELMKRVHTQRQKAEIAKTVGKAEYELKMVKASELKVLGVIGQGAFGLVSLAKTTGANPRPLALKQLQKKRLVLTKQVNNVVREKKIMCLLMHPHILKLDGTFSDKNCLYFVLEYLQGGDVFSRLCKQGGRFDMNTARAYAACVTDGFHYIHDKSILYRDLKPENLVLDRNGVIKIVDFGMAKMTMQRTYTVCGTPEYMAPEIINGRGHHKAVDYWALGILIHEMLLGNTPFGDNGTSHLIIYKRVNQKEKIDFPRSLTKSSDGKEAVKIINQLLQKRPTRRLGCLQAGCAGVKNMVWFKKINWKKVRDGSMPMPLKPRCKDQFDMSNFDDWGDQHEVIDFRPSNAKFEKTWDEHFPECGMVEFGGK